MVLPRCCEVQFYASYNLKQCLQDWPGKYTVCRNNILLWFYCFCPQTKRRYCIIYIVVIIFQWIYLQIFRNVFKCPCVEKSWSMCAFYLLLDCCYQSRLDIHTIMRNLRAQVVLNCNSDDRYQIITQMLCTDKQSSDTLYLHKLNQIRAWVNNDICAFVWNVIINPDAGLANYCQ